MTEARPHVVWDWNGTLLDDVHVVLDAVNSCLGLLGVDPLDLDGYRTHFRRPVQQFYEAVARRRLDDATWDTLEAEFNRCYLAGLRRARLAAGATDALERVAAAGVGQSILSMWDHDLLGDLVDRLGIRARFARVDGVRGRGGAHKAGYLGDHLASLGLAPDGVLVVGDSLDDAHAAAHVGAACVLVDGGSHHRGALAAAGVPVADGVVHAACHHPAVGSAHASTAGVTASS